MPYFSHDDIAQIGTAPAPSPVGAVRLSGDGVFAMLARLAPDLDALRAAPVVRGCHDGRLAVRLSRYGPEGRHSVTLPCPARFFIMPAPASYTREDVAEIHLPGSPALLGAALRTLVDAGARPAAPGEFTFRAFRNGRITLGQAEAVENVIRAADDAERRRALSRLGDRSMADALAWRERLMDMAARLEAALDFSEEELEGDPARELAMLAAELAAQGAELAASRRECGTGLPHVALAGLANAGKSSLFNALLGDRHTLVSPVASTTRDSLRREVSWEGVRFVLSDNPGYHPEGTSVAGAAAEKAWRGLGSADATVWVLDAAQPFGAAEEAFAAGLGGETVLFLNKTDLPAVVGPEDAKNFAARRGLTVTHCLETSAVSGRGIGEARRALARLAIGREASGPWNGRETLELSAALEACRAAAAELSGPGRLELAAEDVRRAAEAFSRFLGEGYGEEALTRIFSAFCVGK